MAESIDKWGHNLSRRVLATRMRNILDKILPQILESPRWLPKALDDFSDNETIELYNVVMHDVDPEEWDEIPF